MNTDLTRQYDLPTPVFQDTFLDQPDTIATDTLPHLNDLVTLRDKLNTMLPATQSRLKELEQNLSALDKQGVDHATSGKTKTIKQESIEASPIPSSSKQTPMERKSRQEHVKKPQKKSDKKIPHPQETGLDFIRVKPKDQVPLTTFWTTLEPYFRTLTEQDRAFLLEKSDNATPYLIPPLGRHYTHVWAEQDQAIGLDTKTKMMAHNVEEEASLTDRLLSSLVAEDLIDPSELLQPDEEQEGEQNQTSDEIVGFEERLKRELRYAGLFGDDDMDWNAKEDDEICTELRSLGREFKEQVKINSYRKNKLLQVVDSQLQFEQYRHVLDTLDSQVEQGYMKRYRPQKTKKRKLSGPKTILSEHAVFAMHKRKTWIHALGAIFKDKNLIMPHSSIYHDQV